MSNCERLRPGPAVNPVLGAMRAGWEEHVTQWLAKADSLSRDLSRHPGGWSLSQADVLRYLRGRLDALMAEVESEAKRGSDDRDPR